MYQSIRFGQKEIKCIKSFISLHSNVFNINNFNYKPCINTKEFASKVHVTIGDVTKQFESPKNPELVPQKYVERQENGEIKMSQSTLHHLRWMLQKDHLKQDMFLLGYPGKMRRTLIMQFLEMTNRELEYIALSRDTTESDLKQRREIKDKAAIYYDQCAVRAAMNGRILILDGVEHTERNVLPILNNLLENREMHLENGKFLMSPQRYDELLMTNSKKTLDDWGLIRVSENFRVVALGLPTEKYKGTPLDPPFRSRFQCRNVTHFSYNEILMDLKNVAPKVNEKNLQNLLSFALSIHSSNMTKSIPDFPLDNLPLVAKMMNSNSEMTVYESIIRLYPYESILPSENVESVLKLFQNFDITCKKQQPIDDIKIEKLKGSHEVKFTIGKKEIILAGGNEESYAQDKFSLLDYQKNLLAEMIEMFAVSDICLIGQKGVGKSALVEQLIKRLGQSMETIVLYEDMTARDLIQQRVTAENGDTIWRDSPLIRAAKNGKIAILDGINRLHKSAATILQRLVHDREIQLCDGTLLLRDDRYKKLLENGFTTKELDGKKIERIHDSFRIIAMAEPTTKKITQLSPEILSLFTFLEVRPLQQAEEYELISNIYGDVDPCVKKIIQLSQNLRKSTDPIHENLATVLSTRQILKIANRVAVYPGNYDDHHLNTTYDIMQNTFLVKFMPALSRKALENVMSESRIVSMKKNDKAPKTIEIKNNILRIGSTKYPIIKTNAETKVPNTLFYDMPQHIELLEKLLQDFVIGEHILLIGNQGVGKNKVIDKLLQLINKPREYLQLHRDTTVHSLTVQSTLVDGNVIFEDSPLVKAVKYGHALVIDEADKAPINVTCILRTLVENGEMTLSDGRKIIPTNAKYYRENKDIIKTHPEFRMIVLANRPGYPFLGNDFFSTLGDVFSCHAVDNPSPNSEIFLLQQYGPNVPLKTLELLVDAFGELRAMADEGLLNYPYSTREVVNIVKHLEKFPDESMSELIGNVLDFDRYSPETLSQVTSVLLKHGLKIHEYADDNLFSHRIKKPLQVTVNHVGGKDASSPKHGKIDPKNEPHVGGNTWAGGTGGRDTAGLGGKGGPYRLDAGHRVHQLSDEEKNALPEHVKAAAREMNRKAFADKLKEIQMSPHDYKIYAQYSEPNRQQVQQLKSILIALQTKSKERQWQNYQTSGEIDDTRLIEGIIGEKNIYRRRGEVSPWTEQVNEKPNRLRLVVDCSGSMYRFNGYDGRLDRQLEAVIMVMEAFEGYEKKVLYDIVGHSGESSEIPFVAKEDPPKDDKRRLEIIRMMHAHSQYCWSGDNTLQATKKSIETLLKEDNDSIVIVLSDANLSRYNIQPKELGDVIMQGGKKVHGHVIFIGSLAEEAAMINKKMPSGHSSVCMDLTMLPQILKQIFTSSLL